jgi:hypothetical protein
MKDVYEQIQQKEAQEESRSKKDEVRRESPAGYHFYYSYWSNPRNWYLHYVLGLKPRFTAPPLVFGAAIHEAIAEYFLKKDINQAVRVFEEEMTSRKEEYENQEKWEEDFSRGPMMISDWYETWGEYDEENHEILEVETPYGFWIGPDDAFYFTVRPDRVKKNKKTKIIRPFDTKTTGYSVTKAIQQVESEDQITAYIWALNRAHPDWNVKDAVADIMYNRKSKYDSVRSDPIYRTSLDQKIFELNIVGTIIEVTQKVKALKTYPWPLLFPRNGQLSGLFGDPYESISRLDIKPGEIPPGFIRDEWIDLESILDNVDLDKWLDYKETKAHEND